MVSVGYNDESEILEVEFISGDVYQYIKVPFKVYLALMKAKSYGQYFNFNIRDAYDFKKVN